MICPQCNAEYRDGFYMCADCNVRLVRQVETAFDDESDQSLPDSSPGLNLVVLIDTTDAIFLDEAVCILEEREIPYVVHSGTGLNLTSDDFANLSWRAILSVPEVSKEEAKRIIQQVKSGALRAANREEIRHEPE